MNYWAHFSFVISLVYVMKRRRIDINQALCPSSTVVSQWPMWEVTDGRKFFFTYIDRCIYWPISNAKKQTNISKQTSLSTVPSTICWNILTKYLFHSMENLLAERAIEYEMMMIIQRRNFLNWLKPSIWRRGLWHHAKA